LARKILLADDSVTAQNMGRKILTDAGYDVITVNNGSAALKRVAEQKPDLIVLDVYMPGYSGLEVCARLKDAPDTSRIPILLTVGKLEPFKPEEATRVRADAFIVKPFEASELLSALTRLEDRMVPAQSEGARFSGSVTGVERFSGGDPSVKKGSEDDADSGWKNRLRFPSKKKKEEPEPEPEPDFVTPSSFREFRRGGGKAPAGTTPFPLSTAPAAAQEPGLVPDIPRDITPEELDALSELAAKLDGAPAVEQTAPAAEQVTEAVAKVETPAPEVGAPEAIVEQAPQVESITAVAPEENEKAFEVAPPPVDGPRVEVVEAPAPVETAAPTEVSYKTEAAIAQAPAPIDREDEPTFAATSIPEPVATAEAPSEIAPAELPVTAVESPLIDTPVVEAAIQSTPEPAPVESQKVEDSPSVDPMPAAAASAREASVSDGSSPSAEELAEALRFLTPSQPVTVPQSLAEAGAALAQELAQGGTGRWVAEAVALSPEEASGSLEAEMFRTFSGGQPAAPGDSLVEQHTEAAAATQSASVPANAELEQSSTPAKVTEEVSEESTAPTTFADAVRNEENRDDENTPANQSVVTAEAGTQAEAASAENGPEGEEVMAKETKGKGGKSNWHQIRSGAPAGNDAVEAAKQSEEGSKTMAAAASADNGSEASHIANIVDSVLADLRPKIVEEIAKQLAKK
jgi:CheY-like chemotaxis protein